MMTIDHFAGLKSDASSESSELGLEVEVRLNRTIERYSTTSYRIGVRLPRSLRTKFLGTSGKSN